MTRGDVVDLLGEAAEQLLRTSLVVTTILDLVDNETMQSDSTLRELAMTIESRVNDLAKRVRSSLDDL